MTACCDRRPEDGHIDRENINRAVQGRYAKLSPREIVITVARLMRQGLGTNEISGHLNYSRTQVAQIQREIRDENERRRRCG